MNANDPRWKTASTAHSVKVDWKQTGRAVSLHFSIVKQLDRGGTTLEFIERAWEDARKQAGSAADDFAFDIRDKDPNLQVDVLADKADFLVEPVTGALVFHFPFTVKAGPALISYDALDSAIKSISSKMTVHT